MSASSSWQRWIARRLVRHAGALLHSMRPTWSAAMESELEHVPGHYRALLWALGCVHASYLERFGATFRVLVIAIFIGYLFAALDVSITGVMAATAWPHWFSAFAIAHRHLSLELWSFAMLLPVTFLAAGLGILLARLAKNSLPSAPYVALGAWLIHMLAFTVVPTVCLVQMATLWDDFLRFPASYIAGVVLPSSALIVGFRRAQRVTN
jgi:hypothetical protein